MGKFNIKKSIFKSSENGSVGLIVALALISVVMGTLALTIDLGKAQTGYIKTSDAADATAHAVATFIEHWQANYYATTNDPNWQNIYPDQTTLNNYASTVYLQNLSNDQSSAQPIPTN